MKRHIPATMATQHPDNAYAPFWKRSSPFVSAHEEPDECAICLRDLKVQEFMWDWEGKYADEAVIDKLFSHHYEYFKKLQIGTDVFLTFRLPNVWKERGYNLIRALMVILTSEDFAHDLSFKARPLFEVILPMTERAEQLLYIQKSFRELARFKSRVFKHREGSNGDYVEMIPLVEGVQDQIDIRTLLSDYVRLHKKHFGRKPAYMRPFLARSDPALVSGFVANVLANKIALSDIYGFGKEHRISMYPVIGAGSLVFRGGLNPARCREFVLEYGGVRTVTLQSAFRYDYPRPSVEKSIRYLQRTVPKSPVQRVKGMDRAKLIKIIGRFSKTYQSTLDGLVRDLEPLFSAVPKRRERHQHIGLLSYHRHMGRHSLPRAINFAAACYSLGVPPEFIGLGRALSALTKEESRVLHTYYKYFRENVIEAGRYVNRENIRKLARRNTYWKLIADDIELAEKFLGVRFAPKTKRELLHHNLTSQLLLQRSDRKEMRRLIEETGKLRRSLG